MAMEERDCGAHILDVNVGLPEVDEAYAMKQAIETISVQAKLPICIDSSRVEVIESALRICPGRALVNSVSTKAEHLNKLLPIVKKYHAMFILLPIGDNGISKTASGRICGDRGGIRDHTLRGPRQTGYAHRRPRDDGIVRSACRD